MCDEDLDLPVFAGHDDQVTHQPFKVIAAVAPLGQLAAGHCVPREGRRGWRKLGHLVWRMSAVQGIDCAG